MNDLVERLGGTEAVHAAVDDLYRRILADPALAPYFDGVDLDRQRGHMTDVLVVVLGGHLRPDRLTGVHAHLHLTDDVFDRTAGHLLDTLATLGVDPAAIDDVIAQVAALRSKVLGS